MKIDKDLVDKIAHLARLEFQDEQKVKIEEDLNRILSFMESLNEVDTSAVAPLIYLSDEVNVFRADVVKQEITHEEALRNAPKKDSDYFRVPKVIDQK
ncbi:MAG: Asp-tRNA(Asn)/Glu-tRNA(Gln) amidotransferase subunit GatC [Sphingobacteriales bacterium]|jgi:aspartyl-tRNA(Asn)/glutamyl-tRNA(Gln) amidotransferase subunit C|nr:Asp-tRNA(Asn)/Glu-tRNA(Gln) amidotransferase subunit GatC [Sphingobacteriales bacterium]